MQELPHLRIFKVLLLSDQAHGSFIQYFIF